MTATCAVEECTRSIRSLGLCASHYKRHQRGITVTGPLRLKGQGFDSFVERVGDCWIWRGTTSNGYGRFHVPGTSSGSVPTLAHRFAYEREHGAIPEGLQLDHLCRTRACVNPAHLEPVTAAENLRRAREAS